MPNQNFQLSPYGFNNQQNYTANGQSSPVPAYLRQPQTQYGFNSNNPSPMQQPTGNNGQFTMPDYGSNTVKNFDNLDLNSPAGVNTMENMGLQSGGGADWSVMDRIVGAQDANGNKIGGAAMPAIQLGTGLLQGYIGMKQLGLAEEQFDESKDQFNLNYDAQRSSTNAQLRDRQKARVAANSGAYQSVDEYMNENRIKAR